MRRTLCLLRLSPLVFLASCAIRTGTSGDIARDVQAMPPNTVMLSQMMRELSSEPGFTEALLQQIDKGQKNGAVLTPTLFDLFRKMVLGKDWSGLDRFPGWTIHQVTRTVNGGEHFIDTRPANSTDDMIRVQLGPYPLGKEQTVSLDAPSDRGAFTEQGLVDKLSDRVTRGDGPDPKLAPLHAESARLAEVLNRLSLNGFAPDNRILLDRAEPFAVTMTLPPGLPGPETPAPVARTTDCIAAVHRAQSHRGRRAFFRELRALSLQRARRGDAVLA